MFPKYIICPKCKKTLIRLKIWEEDELAEFWCDDCDEEYMVEEDDGFCHE